MPNIISNRIGFSFAMPLVIVGFVMILGGILSITENIYIGIGMAILGGFISFSDYGTQIDKTVNKYREYSSFYWIKRGEWKSLEKYPFLCVLPSRTGMTIYSRTNKSTTNIDDSFDICLLSANHRGKIVIQKLTTKDEAIVYAETLSSEINIPVVKYNPVVNDKTKSRRR